MDIAAKLSVLPGARPLPGFLDAWEWSPAPGFVLLAALSSDRRYVFRLNTKDSYDAGMCHAVLEFVREREDEVIGRPQPLIAVCAGEVGGEVREAPRCGDHLVRGLDGGGGHLVHLRRCRPGAQPEGRLRHLLAGVAARGNIYSFIDSLVALQGRGLIRALA